MHRAYPECLLSLRYETPHLLHVTWVSPAKPEDFRAAILEALCDNARSKTSYKKYWVGQDLKCQKFIFMFWNLLCSGAKVGWKWIMFMNTFPFLSSSSLNLSRESNFMWIVKSISSVIWHDLFIGNLIPGEDCWHCWVRLSDYEQHLQISLCLAHLLNCHGITVE